MSEKIINFLVRNQIRDLNFSIPAIVVGVQRLKQGYVDVKPIVNRINVQTGDTFERTTIKNVRLIFPSNKTSTICFPVKQGDQVRLVFQNCSIQQFLDGNTNPHDPVSNAFLNLNDVTAEVGFQTTQESCFDANNYSEEFDSTSLNIVHNKNTPQESKIEIKESGDVIVKTNSNIETKSSSFDIESETVNTNNAVINVDNDIVIQGVSLMQFIRSHTHNYTDDGNPMVTAPPNPI